MSHGAPKKRRSRPSFAKSEGKGASRNGVDYTGATKSGCSSGKWGWPNDEKGRRGARTLKRVLRRANGADGAVREYVCPECGRWHVGHLPTTARRGKSAAGDYYAKRRNGSQAGQNRA